MNPLGKFRARPSLVLSIRQRRRFYAEYRREMQEKVDTGIPTRQDRFHALKISLMITKKTLLIIYNIFNAALNIFIIFLTIYFQEISKRLRFIEILSGIRKNNTSLSLIIFPDNDNKSDEKCIILINKKKYST